MTPQEKAQELFDKFYIYTNGFAKENAKNFSIIAVNEILNFLEDDRCGFSWKKYYIEVKQEIKKL